MSFTSWIDGRITSAVNAALSEENIKKIADAVGDEVSELLTDQTHELFDGLDAQTEDIAAKISGLITDVFKQFTALLAKLPQIPDLSGVFSWLTAKR